VYLFVAIDFRQQGRLCRAAPARHAHDSRRVPAPGAAGLALQSAHGAPR
jgi:hypothetical protein